MQTKKYPPVEQEEMEEEEEDEEESSGDSEEGEESDGVSFLDLLNCALVCVTPLNDLVHN